VSFANARGFGRTPLREALQRLAARRCTREEAYAFGAEDPAAAERAKEALIRYLAGFTRATLEEVEG
jgi:hypothetical protein